MEYKNAKSYDIHGCLNTDQTGPPASKYYANVKYSIRNHGVDDFIAPSGFVDHAACGTSAILSFLDLIIEGGLDPSGNAYGIELNRFAACVIDDSNAADAAACVAGGPSTDFTTKPSSPSMGIQQGGSYGVSKTVHARFPLTADQFNALKNSLASTLKFTLSVNKYISPDGAAGVATAVDGSQLKDVTWEASGQGTFKQIYSAPTAAPTALPTVSPSTIVCDNTM